MDQVCDRSLLLMHNNKTRMDTYILVSTATQCYTRRICREKPKIKSTDLAITDKNIILLTAFISYIEEQKLGELTEQNEQDIARLMRIGTNRECRYAIEMAESYDFITTSMDRYAFGGIIWGLDHCIGVNESFDHKAAVMAIDKIRRG